MASNPKPLRFASAITCISDFYLTGKMERTEENLSCRECIKAYKAFGEFTKLPENQQIWKNIGKIYPASKIFEIEALEDSWNLLSARLLYNMEKRKILASQILKRIFIENGGDLFKTGKLLEVYPWEFLAWVNFAAHMPKSLIETVEEIGDRQISIEEMKAIWDTKNKGYVSRKLLKN